MSKNGSFRGLLNTPRRLSLTLVFLSQSMWAQAPATTMAAPGNQSTVTAKPTEAADPDKKYSGTVKVTTLGRGIEDDNLKSTVGWTFVEAGVNTEYTDWLGFDIGVVGIFGEGGGQNYLSDEGGGTNALLLDYAGVNIKPWKPVTLKAGVIGYQINPLYTTMTPSTTLGAEQKLELATSSETFKITFQGNEAVPSTGIKKGLVEEEKNPFFLAGSVIGEVKIKPIATVLKVAGTQFRFGNLPKSEASKALLSGNSQESITGTADNMSYVIGFAGKEAAAVIETDWTSKIKTTAKAVYIINERGFEDTNEGRMGRLELRMVMGNVALKPVVTVFEVEADTTPGAYTILANRYNNRKGQVLGMNLELIKQKLNFFGSYTKADIIASSPVLSDREIYNLGVEVNYDLF